MSAPAPGQTAAGNLHQLASRILRDPSTRVDIASMEPHAAGRCNIVIILKGVDVLGVTGPGG